MAQKNSDLDKDKLKPEFEAAAARILRQNKNVKRVEIEGEIKMETARTGTGKLGRGSETGQRSKGGPSATSGQDGSLQDDSGQAEEEQGEKPEESAEGEPDKKNGDESGKKKDGEAGKKDGDEEKPGEPAAPSTGSGQDSPGQGEKPEEPEKEGEKSGGTGEEKEKSEPGSGEEDNKKEKGEAEADKEGGEQGDEKTGDQGEKKAGEKGEKEGDKKPGEGSEQEPSEGKPEKKDQGGLNNRLLNQDQEDGAAEKLKEKKQSGEGEEKEAGEEGSGGEPKSLRQRVMAARQAMDLKAKAKEKMEAAVTAPAKRALSQILKQSWLNLIDSFGLTLIWINIHVFLRWVLGEKLFCKLGEEWLPKQISQAGGSATEPVTKGVGLVEVIVLLVLDLIVLAVIGVFLTLIVMIVDFMQSSVLEKIEMFIGGLTTLGWEGIKALYDLFVW